MRRVVDPWGAAFGIALPFAAAAAGLLLTTLWEPRLPGQIASHWTTSRADGFSTPMTSAWVYALVVVLVGGGCGFVAAFAQALLLMRRAMLVIGTTVTGLMLTLEIAVLASQLDLESGQDVRFPAWSIGVGVVAGFGVGALGAALLRDHRARVVATAPPAPELPRGPARAVGDVVGFGRTGVIVFVVVTLGPALLASAAVGSLWPLWTACPVVAVLVALMRFDVVVDAHGVRVRNLGLSSIDIGIDEVAGAKVTEVSPFTDFGGWGLRLKSRGRYGIVTHTGPAVEIATAGTLTLTITSRKAEQLAGALNTFAARGR